MEQLYDALRALPAAESRSLVEIGTFRGHRARKLARAAFRRSREVRYFGFDLFELGTPALMEAESTHTAPPQSEVEALLAEFSSAVSRPLLPWQRRTFRFELHRGYTSETLPAFCAAHPELRADFVFLDGGHSLATIDNDWEYCRRLILPGGTIFLDDYYEDPSYAARYGCNRLVTRLKEDPQWDLEVLPVADPQPRAGSIRLVRAVRRSPGSRQ